MEEKDFKDQIINQYREQTEEQNKILHQVLEIISVDNKNKCEERKRNGKDRLVQLAIILFFTSLITITFIVSYFFGTYTTDYNSTLTSTSESKYINENK
jgi:hypothetical protein